MQVFQPKQRDSLYNIVKMPNVDEFVLSMMLQCKSVFGHSRNWPNTIIRLQ